MEELQVIETTSGRQFKPWVDADKMLEIVRSAGTMVMMTEAEKQPALDDLVSQLE